jgi:allantoicase
LSTKDQNHDDQFSSQWINLADARVGTQVLYATDEFFAEKENLILPGRGVFIADKYTDRGKWMDGWESRRKRVPGNDHCIIKLGLPGTIFGFDIDTNFFLGNHPPFAAVEACELKNGDPTAQTIWEEILPKSPLKPGSQNLFSCKSTKRYTHVRLQIYPDGGVARFRVYGQVSVDWSQFKSGQLVDLAAVQNGAKVLCCNDMFFSSKDNLIMPGRGVNMGDGWETKRKRDLPGFDWSIIALGHRGKIKKIEIDTAHFKGNYPDRAMVEGLDAASMDISKNPEKLAWQALLPETKLQADHQHYYENEIQNLGPISHVKLNIIPDGGISRLRIWGELV